METLKYSTKIDSNGMLQVPINSNYFGQEVDIIIIPKQEIIRKNNSAKNFVKKWAGFLKGTDTEDSKYNYLMEKYK